MRNLLKVLAVMFSWAGFVGVISPAWAGTISFQEGVSPSTNYVADATFVRDMLPNDTHNSTRPNELIVGTSSGDNLRTLLEFDLSEIAIQASGRTVIIDGIQLVLNANSVYHNNSITVDVYQYDYDLAEATSTWNNPDGLGADGTAGGSFGAFLVSREFSTAGDVIFSDTAAFHTAVSNALGSSDHTLRFLLADHDEGASGIRLAYFRSNEYATSGDRPELIVDFTVVPEPSSLALLCCGGLAVLGMARRRKMRGKP